MNKVIPVVSAIISVTPAITVIMATTPVPAVVLVVPAVTTALLVGIIVIRVGLSPGVHTLEKIINYVPNLKEHADTIFLMEINIEIHHMIRNLNNNFGSY